MAVYLEAPGQQIEPTAYDQQERIMLAFIERCDDATNIDPKPNTTAAMERFLEHDIGSAR